MAIANITAPQGTQQGDFTVGITLDVGVTDLTADKLSATAVSGNGITGVTFEVLPDTDMDASTYNVMFYLPEDVEGELEIDITGMVTRVGSSTPEAVTANSVTVAYDNITNVSVTLGTPEYRDGGQIAIPVTFAENVVAPSKTVFPISSVNNSDLSGFTYVLYGEGTAYELVVTVPPNRSGEFRISANGHVLKASTLVWDDVVVTPLDVAYNTTLPLIVDYDVPGTYEFGENFDFRVALHVPATGWHLNNTFSEIWIEEGTLLGTPTPYKWTGANPPDIHAALPDNLSGTDWQQLAAPPSPPTPGMNDFNDDGTQWHGEEGQYFLVRIQVSNPDAIGVPQYSLRSDNSLRGPVS